MKTKEAKKIKLFLSNAVTAFMKIYKKEISTEKDIDLIKIEFCKENFLRIYKDFIEELKFNILEYKKIQIIYDYLCTHVGNLKEWSEYLNFIYLPEYKKIIEGEFEEKFLMELKDNIESYVHRICSFSDIYYIIPENDELLDTENLLYKFMLELNLSPEQIGRIEFNIFGDYGTENVNSDGVPYMDFKFDFDEMKIEIDQLTNTNNEKIILINDRLFDLEQWQVKYDKLIIDPDNGSHYEYSDSFYPHFKELCHIELKRYEKMEELEKAIPNQTENIRFEKIEPASYSWKSSGTDLLELVVALHKNDTIQRKDGKPLSRKELIDFFQQLFGLEIKDVEGKLSRATSRKMNMTPFLDNLKVAFENYRDEKEEKQQKRK